MYTPGNMRKKRLALILTVIFCCIAMALVETVIEPPYAVKSALKAGMFLIVPAAVMKSLGIGIFGGTFSLDIKKFLKLLALGLGVYAVIFLSFALTRGIFDYPGLIASLSKDQQVEKRSFLPVALYISFGNSFVEEFLFRHTAFIRLREFAGKRAAYIFSSLMFSVYHVAMIGQSFPLPMMAAALLGLAVGGFIFDFADDRSGNIYGSWFIHMFADFALMMVWRIYI